LPEVGLDRVREADRGDLAGAVGPRQGTSPPGGPGERCEPQRISRYTDEARFLVREAVFGVAAALDDSELAGIVEVLQPDQAGVQRELRAGVGVVPDEGRAELCRRDADPASAARDGRSVVA